MHTTRNLIIFLLFALPLIFSPFSLLSFELPKILFFYLICSLIIYYLLTSSFKISLSKAHYLYLVFFAFIIFSSFFGLSFSQSFWGSYFRWQGILSWACYSLLFLISGYLFKDHHFRKQASFAILVAAVFTASLAIIQFVTLWFLGNNTQLLYSNRVISTFGQPNFLGAFLVMSLPFAWYLSLRSRFASVAIIIIVLGVFSTLSRSAYLGLAVLALIWSIKHYKLLLTGMVLSVFLFGALATFSPNLVYQEWYRFKVDTKSSWTAENRLTIDQKSVQLITQRPLLGYGLENFSLAFPEVVTNNDLGLKDIVVDSAHNLFLDLAVQLGLIGLILFIAILILTIIISGLKQKDDFTKACLGVVIVFLIVHQFSPVSIVPMVIFWISMGILSPVSLNYSHIKSGLFIRIISISLISVTVFFIIQTFRADNLFRTASSYEVIEINKAISLDNEAIGIAPWINFYKVRRDFLLKQLGY